MKLLSVRNLCKTYPRFALQNVSFALSTGTITGFIGRNGAGKTTTLKALVNLVHPDEGEIAFFGRPFVENELSVKQRIGFVSGGVHYYPAKKLRAITEVTRRFYDRWDESAYRDYLERFELREDQTPKELSEGMKVKYALALALSHNAELLILDEPTSGLDPVSRDDLLDVFLTLVAERSVTILFSTHITSDLEKCADNILYLQKGRLIGDAPLDDFLRAYKVARWERDPRGLPYADRLIGCKRDRNAYSALVRAADLPLPDAAVSDARLEDMMVHLDQEGGQA